MNVGRFLAPSAAVILVGLFAVSGGGSQSGAEDSSDWQACRDDEHGFTLHHPPDWQSTTAPGRCVQLQKGTSMLPDGVPAVDVFIRVEPLRGDFPAGYLRENLAGPEPRPNPVVPYTDRQELIVGGLPAVRARFRTAGPTPNWGVEYAVGKHDHVLRLYISQPQPEIERLFDRVVNTLSWPSN